MQVILVVTVGVMHYVYLRDSSTELRSCVKVEVAVLGSRP